MQHPSLIWLATVFLFAVLMLWAAYSDAKSFTIPNRLPIGIALLYPAFVIAAPTPVDWTGALMVSGALLVTGFVAFALKGLGGGDAKLLAAASLWAGTPGILDFILVTALTGGVMAGTMWLHHRFNRAPAITHVLTTPADEDFAKEPMPYGVALCMGGLYTAFTILGLV